MELDHFLRRHHRAAEGDQAAARLRAVERATDGGGDRPDVVRQVFSVLQLCHGWLNFPVLVGCLLAEAHCGNVRWFSASKWLDQVKAFGATAVDVFLPMAGALMARPREAGERNHAIRVCIGAMGSVGEIDRLTAFEERFGITSVNIYGVTEGGGLATTENLADIRRRGSVGKPTSHFEVMVADEQGRAVPVGEQGEILMRPTLPCIMSLGYLGEADKTLDTWRDLWIHSADYGYFDQDGYLYFTGRQPHWLRRKGENVSAREVEDALRALPGVADAAVVGVPSPIGDEDIKAFVVLDAGVALVPAAIHADLQAKLAAFKLPRYIEIVTDFARTIKAEPDRKRLRASGLSGREWDGEAR